VDILCVFLLQYVDSVIECDNSDKPFLHINNRERKKIIFVKKISGNFLVVMSVYENDIRFHKILNFIVVIVQKKLFNSSYADKMTRCVCNITGVNRFFVNTRSPYALKSVFNGAVTLKVDKFRSHNRTGTVFGIFKKRIYGFTSLRICIFKNSFNNRCRHFLDNVNGIIKVKLVDNLFKLRI